MSTEVLACLMFGASLLLSVGLTPLARKLALSWGVVDRPGARKIHTLTTARMGGAAIFIAWLLPVVVVVSFRDAHWARLFGGAPVILGVILSATAMFALGLYDDFRGLGAGLKLPAEVAAAIALYVIGFRIENVSSPFGPPVALGVLALPVTVVWIVGLTNAVNLMDGIDGLAAGVAALTAVFIGFAAEYGGSTHTTGILYAVPIAGAALGFLIYNFPPASIFMGDCGSLFLGFALAAISLVSSQKGHAAVAMFVPLIIFGVPVTDTALALLRRYLTGRNLFEADQRHVHHILLERGVSPRHTVLIFYVASALLGGAALLLVNASGPWAPFIVAVVAAGVLLACSRLGYHEFRQVRDFLKHGSAQRKRAIFRRKLLRSVGQCILEEHSLDRVWDMVRQVASMLAYDGVLYEPCHSPIDGQDAESTGRAPQRDFRRRAWTRAHVEEPGNCHGRLESPVEAGGRLYGKLTFLRARARGEDSEERAVIEELCGYVAERMAALEKEIAKRGVLPTEQRSQNAQPDAGAV